MRDMNQERRMGLQTNSSFIEGIKIRDILQHSYNPLHRRPLKSSYPPFSYRADRHALFTRHPSRHPLAIDNTMLHELAYPRKDVCSMKRQSYQWPPLVRRRPAIIIIYFRFPS